jgi:hypothetical protein
VAGQGGGLVADALRQVAVPTDHEGAVVAYLGAEAGPQVALGDRHADGIGDPLAERSGGHLDAGGVAGLGMARCGGIPLSELPQVLEGEAVAGEVQHRVEQDRGVSGRQHEAVPVGPGRIPGVVLEDPGPEHVRQRCKRHGRALVSRPGGVRCVHSQAAEDVDGAGLQGGIEGGAHVGGGSGRGRGRSPYPRGSSGMGTPRGGSRVLPRRISWRTRHPAGGPTR